MNYYLCPIDNSTISKKKLYRLNEKLSINYPADVLLPFKLEEHIFLLQHAEEYLLPYEFSIDSINRAGRTLILNVSSIYGNGLPLPALALLLTEPMLRNYAQLTTRQVQAITSLMNILPALTDEPVELTDEHIRINLADEPVQEYVVSGMDTLNSTLQIITDQFDNMLQLLPQSQASVSPALATLNTTLQAINKNIITQIQLSRSQEQAANKLPAPQVDEPWDVRVRIEPIIDEGAVTGEIISEGEVLDYVKDYIRQCGYYFADETLYNYHICLKTRPFVILAGLSGTGKSKLAQLYAEALGQGETFKRLPVRPNWNDDRYLLGHLNTLTGEYITEPAVEFILAAMANPTRLYSLCLDEMNLAHVEYYFSQFLSAMEGDLLKDRSITLIGQQALAQLQAQRDQLRPFSLPPAEIFLPDNLVFTGTINVDETTQPISDKVIDRANTLEFFNVDLEHMMRKSDHPDAFQISNRAWQSYRASETDTRYRAQIVEINKILKQADMGLGYRVVQEMELYLANSQGLLDPLVAFDLQCKQRILPRIHGSTIETMLVELLTLSKKNGLSRTEQRLQEMKSRLKRDGYTSFWR